MSHEKGSCQTAASLKLKDDTPQPEIIPLDRDDIALLKTYSGGPYHAATKELEEFIRNKTEELTKRTNPKDNETGLAPPAMWDLAKDHKVANEELALIVGYCKRIFDKDTDKPKYLISLQHQQYVVGLHNSCAPEDIEEGMRVAVMQTNSGTEIKMALPTRIDPSISMMEMDEKPSVTYKDVGGAKEQIEQLREVVEKSLTDPESFVKLGIDPPKGVLLYGPPGTGKTLLAKAVANATKTCFIRVIGSELVQKYIGEGARMVRELFEMARQKENGCIIFFDEVDAIGTSRGGSDSGDEERTMLEMLNQMDGFDSRGNIRIIMATNRPDTLDPALTRPGRIDRKLEIGLPDLEGRRHILAIHSRPLAMAKNVRFELIARLCPNATGAELKAVCSEAGMFAIRARRKQITEKDMLDAVTKVIKGQHKFSATAKYMVYN